MYIHISPTIFTKGDAKLKHLIFKTTTTTNMNHSCWNCCNKCNSCSYLRTPELSSAWPPSYAAELAHSLTGSQSGSPSDQSACV